eukprot:CAMPEP_0170543964 /NCGR_PEP_ID=MMETSP0211-20121228/2904_1 /TAXON_ID=311385 /ORGANISM="Pseudokeronopsis sp., Strain OXSARD2" /LENGTH=39 /DNA_ID= /DNA_START= /DNA_END= /DNA_ORIENTATION=
MYVSNELTSPQTQLQKLTENTSVPFKNLKVNLMDMIEQD